VNAWLGQINQIVNMFLGNPAAPWMRWVLIVLGVLTLVAVLGKVGEAFRIPNISTVYSLTAAVVGIGLTLAVLTAAALYLPAWKDAAIQRWMLIGVPVVVSVIVVVPLMCMLQRANFMASLVTWAIGVAAMAAVVLLVGAIFKAFLSGDRDFNRGKLRKQEIEQLIK
jgi:hypothetical protein